MDSFRGRDLGDRSEDDERFESVYRANYARVLAYALRRSSPDVAHDVVADAFLVAWRRLDRLPEEPLPWLLAVARRTLANHRRSGRRGDALRARLEALEAGRISGVAQGSSLTLEEIVEALGRLPESDQELLELIAWDGLAVGEAAAVVGVSAAACRVRLYRARHRLARELARGGEVRTPCAARQFPELAKER